MGVGFRAHSSDGPRRLLLRVDRVRHGRVFPRGDPGRDRDAATGIRPRRSGRRRRGRPDSGALQFSAWKAHHLACCRGSAQRRPPPPGRGWHGVAPRPATRPPLHAVLRRSTPRTVALGQQSSRRRISFRHFAPLLRRPPGSSGALNAWRPRCMASSVEEHSMTAAEIKPGMPVVCGMDENAQFATVDHMEGTETSSSPATQPDSTTTFRSVGRSGWSTARSRSTARRRKSWPRGARSPPRP